MLGVAGVLGQEILRPDVFWYEAGLPENLPGPFKNINMGGLLAWEFILMHFVEVLRWQDYKNFGSVNQVRSSSRCRCRWCAAPTAGTITEIALAGAGAQLASCRAALLTRHDRLRLRGRGGGCWVVEQVVGSATP
jgi:hypothetical protein